MEMTPSSSDGKTTFLGMKETLGVYEDKGAVTCIFYLYNF